MNILLVAYYFPPINSGGSVRPERMAHWLRQFGHSVFVLTSGYGPEEHPSASILRVHDPAYARAHQGKHYRRWFWRRGLAELQNISGQYASIFSSWKRSVLGRMEEIGRIVRPDLVIATYPPIEVLEIGLAFSRHFHIPLVSDFRDGLLFQPIEEKRLRSYPCIREKYKRTEAAIASASALITVVKPVLQKYFNETYPECRCKTVLNGYDPREWLDLPPLPLPPGFFCIVHTGRLALSDSATDIRPFLAALRQAAQDARPKPVRLHLIGEYSRRERTWMKEMIKAGIVTIHPLLDRRKTLAFQKSADLLLVLTRPGVRSGIPLKLFEYVFSGKPVLALTDDAEIRQIVEESGSGWCVSPVDGPAVTGLLKHILADPAFRTSLKRSPQKIECYSWESQMIKLHRLLSSLPH